MSACAVDAYHHAPTVTGNPFVISNPPEHLGLINNEILRNHVLTWLAPEYLGRTVVNYVIMCRSAWACLQYCGSFVVDGSIFFTGCHPGCTMNACLSYGRVLLYGWISSQLHNQYALRFEPSACPSGRRSSDQLAPSLRNWNGKSV